MSVCLWTKWLWVRVQMQSLTRVMLGHWPIITPQRSDFCGVKLGQIEKAPPTSFVTLLLSPLLWKDKFFSRILPIYFRHTFFVTPSNGYFHKANKNFKSIRQPNIQLMLQENLLKMLIIRYRSDRAKYFLTNYSYVWCVTLIQGYPNDINWCCSGVIIVNLGHI